MAARSAGVVLAAFLVLTGGCASHRPAPGNAQWAEQRCELLYQALDQATRRAGRIDAGAVPVPYYAYLRTDRFSASLKDRAADGEAFAAWIERMRALDLAARELEFANLPSPERERLTARFPALREGLAPALEPCARTLARHDFESASARAELRRTLSVPDDYDTWKRVVGIYVLTRIPFSSGVRNYQAQTTAVFQRPRSELPVRGQLLLYAPASAVPADAAEIQGLVSTARIDALGIPVLDATALERLFDAFAPVYWIDTVDDNDRIGALELDAHGGVDVDIAQPLQYRRLAYTRYGSEIWLQLIYSVWLPARPRTSAFDLLGGHLDGITWRVTLDAKGVPMVYDAIHNCGCYHQFFPTSRMRVKPQPDTLDETAFVPQRVEDVQPGERIWLRIATSTHYLERVLPAPQQSAASIAYGIASDDTLRSLSVSEGISRSAFRSDGIVPGTERGERWLFWPMGVREPGAMREWGHHATAFIGRRHFDDADLIERYFEPVP
jgi:hypothetical protein